MHDDGDARRACWPSARAGAGTNNIPGREAEQARRSGVQRAGRQRERGQGARHRGPVPRGAQHLPGAGSTCASSRATTTRSTRRSRRARSSSSATSCRAARSASSASARSASKSRTRRSCSACSVLGYDPQITVQRAWQLSSGVEQALSASTTCSRARDVVTVHVPLTRGDAQARQRRAPRADARRRRVLNFARGGIVDEAAVARGARQRASCGATSATSRRAQLKDHPKVVALPHLGASTGEAEENCAVMVADTLRDFLENGNIRNSVNFPEAVLPRTGARPRLRSRTRTCRTWSARSRPASPPRNLNIADLLNKSRGELAYTLIDIDGACRRGDARQHRGDRRRARGARAASSTHERRTERHARPASRKPQRSRDGAGRSADTARSLESIRERIDAIDAQHPRAASTSARGSRSRSASRSAPTGRHRRFLPAGARSAGAAQGARAQRGAAARRRDRAAVPRNHVGLPRAAGAAEGRFLGPEGTFTQQAVLKHFGHSVRALPLASIERSVRRSARRATPTSASCRSRTRPRARSTTRSTCS